MAICVKLNIIIDIFIIFFTKLYGHRLCFIKIDKYNTHNIKHLIDSCIESIDIEGHIYISHTILNIDNYG